MKLLVDAHVFDDLSQGSKTYLEGIYSAVVDKDSQDDFYFASHDRGAIPEKLLGQANTHHLQFTGHNKFVRLGLNIPDLIKKNKIEWAHFQYISPLVKTCPEIVTIHDLLFLEYPQYFPRDYRVIRNFLFKRSAKRAEWVLTVSEFSRAALIRYYQLDPKKVIITPNGILDFFWEPADIAADTGHLPGLDQFILYVSRFEPRKNQAGLLRSYLDLQLWKQGIQLVFVGGKGIRSAEFDQRYESLNDQIKRMILFFRDLPSVNLKWLYQNSLLFVYPSFAEGFGIPPLEAIACGANVICSSATAMSEFRFLGDRLFEPTRRDEMTQKMDFYLKHPSTDSSTSIRDHVRNQYSWDVAAQRFLSIFR